MFWSAISRFADTITRSPTWVERDGDRDVTVSGYSLIGALGAGATLLAVCVAVLVTLS